jgi:hypothetical protein
MLPLPFPFVMAMVAQCGDRTTAAPVVSRYSRQHDSRMICSHGTDWNGPPLPGIVSAVDASHVFRDSSKLADGLYDVTARAGAALSTSASGYPQLAVHTAPPVDDQHDLADFFIDFNDDGLGHEIGEGQRRRGE